VFLAALGKRDAEIAANGTLVLSGDVRPRVQRQAVGVAWKSVGAGLALTIAAMGVIALLA
jgi:hypothetical protein